MMINYFYGMVDQRKAFGLLSSRDHCQRSSSLWISNMPQAGFEPAQNLSSAFVEWSCALMITTTSWRATSTMILRYCSSTRNWSYPSFHQSATLTSKFYLWEAITFLLDISEFWPKFKTNCNIHKISLN